MGFRLYWNDPNLSEDGHRVYRSASTIDPGALPTEIDTLASDVVSYDDVDGSITASTTYYYRVSAYLGANEVVSDELVISADETDDIIGDVSFYFLMDDITGSTITDESESANNGTIVGGASQTTFGSSGYAISLDGSSQYITLPIVREDGDTETVLSVGAWFKTSSGQRQIILSYDRSEFFRLGISGDGGMLGRSTIGFSCATNAGNKDLAGVTEVADGEWHFVVATYDNGIMSIYLDGFLENSWDSSSATIGNSPDATGEDRYGIIGVGSEAVTQGSATGPDYYFKGLLTKVFELNRVMDANEVSFMFNRGPEL